MSDVAPGRPKPYAKLHCTAPQWSGARPRTNERAKDSVTAAAAGAIGCSFSSSEFVRSFPFVGVENVKSV